MVDVTDKRWYKKVTSVAEAAAGHTLRKMLLSCGHSYIVGSGVQVSAEHFCIVCADEDHHKEACGKNHCAPCCLYEGADRPAGHESQ